MRKTLLAAVAAIATIASASAQTMDGTNTPANNGANNVSAFECVVTKVTPPDKDKDPGYKVNVSIDGDGNFVNVVHTTVSGAVYDRADQYKITENHIMDNNGPNMWFGQSKKHPEVGMGGMFGINNKTGEMHYREFVFRGKAKKPVTEITSSCHQVQA
jgi:hypothetical protein